MVPVHANIVPSLREQRSGNIRQISSAVKLRIGAMSLVRATNDIEAAPFANRDEMDESVRNV